VPHGVPAVTVDEPVRVEFVDTDAGGRIHHTAALRWAERAEHQLLRAVGWAGLTSFPRRRVEASFHAPLRFGDEVVVRIGAAAVGRTSITYAWSVLRDGEVCIEGGTTCVHVDDTDRPCPVPDALRAALLGQPAGRPAAQAEAGAGAAAGRGPGGSEVTENWTTLSASSGA
jgi:acyl-CoA thioester hydrolase